MTVGSIVMSVAGRDVGHYHVILSVEGAFVTLADGKWRKIAKPKRKKVRHVRLVTGATTPIGQKLMAGERVTDRELRRHLAEWEQATALEQEG